MYFFKEKNIKNIEEKEHLAIKIENTFQKVDVKEEKKKD